jgi:hypothetical protein
MSDSFNEEYKKSLMSLIKYAEILEQDSSKEELILKELGINVSAEDIVNLLRDPERLAEAVKKLKLKAFW